MKELRRCKEDGMEGGMASESVNGNEGKEGSKLLLSQETKRVERDER